MTPPSPVRFETWVADPAEVTAWIKAARPGDRFIYARVNRLPTTSQTAARLRALALAGMVSLTQRAAGSGRFEYQARRLAPIRSATPPTSRPRKPACDGAMIRVLRVLRACANATPPLPCPSNRALARAAGLIKPHQASYQIGKLERAKIIASEIVDPVSGARIVTICGTGRRTAEPIGARADG